MTEKIWAQKSDGPAVILQKGKDKAIKNRHHWIFSGAVKFLPEFENGSLLPVMSADGEFLGTAYFNLRCSIIGRMVSFDSTPPLEALQKNLEKSIALRRNFFETTTNAYRLVNGEGDRLPGLILDQYKDVLVLQISTLGMEKLKPFLTDFLIQKLNPRCLYEKSSLPSRREEGLDDFEGALSGEPPETVEIVENDVRFLVDIVRSQKTGFFLDQREMRKLVRSLGKNKKVLDCFSYTGGFSVQALKGGAESVDAVDASERAIELAEKNCSLNGLGSQNHHFYVADVFEFLRGQALPYDLVILDPPAFAKKKADVPQAFRGYRDIHRLVFQKIPPASLVLTFSCSYFFNESLFQKVIFQAARDASRNVRILQRHHQAYDHPVNIYHPEGNYLKGFLLYVE
ncbi:MAG: class I SAM-dependent rRNA methyltransferase [Candidatus Aminicenantales bacterium]